MEDIKHSGKVQGKPTISKAQIMLLLYSNSKPGYLNKSKGSKCLFDHKVDGKILASSFNLSNLFYKLNLSLD